MRGFSEQKRRAGKLYRRQGFTTFLTLAVFTAVILATENVWLATGSIMLATIIFSGANFIFEDKSTTDGRFYSHLRKSSLLSIFAAATSTLMVVGSMEIIDSEQIGVMIWPNFFNVLLPVTCVLILFGCLKIGAKLDNEKRAQYIYGHRTSLVVHFAVTAVAMIWISTWLW